VLAMQPTILVLDEPGVGLDAAGKAEFYAQIQRLTSQGLTVVLVSHDMTEVMTLADTLFVLHQGCLVMQGTPREIFAQPEALHGYGLAAPPLSSLLMHMRRRGLEIPEEVATVDEVYHFLTRKR